MNILIVDDERDILDIYKDYLLRKFPDATIYTVKQVGDALQIIHSNNVDIVITDLVMPERRGEELIDKLAGTKIKVFVSTACSLTQEQIESFQGKIIGWLFKPCYQTELVNCITAAKEIFKIGE